MRPLKSQRNTTNARDNVSNLKANDCILQANVCRCTQNVYIRMGKESFPLNNPLLKKTSIFSLYLYILYYYI
nr:MAG TPA: hypothetical protein [Caudoviricetes sp.]